MLLDGLQVFAGLMVLGSGFMLVGCFRFGVDSANVTRHWNYGIPPKTNHGDCFAMLAIFATHGFKHSGPATRECSVSVWMCLLSVPILGWLKTKWTTEAILGVATKMTKPFGFPSHRRQTHGRRTPQCNAHRDPITLVSQKVALRPTCVVQQYAGFIIFACGSQVIMLGLKLPNLWGKWKSPPKTKKHLRGWLGAPSYNC